MIIAYNLSDYFEKLVSNTNINDEILKSYVLSIFQKYKFNNFDFSNESITLLYIEAKNSQDLYKFQNIGDWLFFCYTMFPEHLNNASEEYYYSIGRLSYYSCYRLINKQWKVFENLADEFIYLTSDIRNKLIKEKYI